MMRNFYFPNELQFQENSEFTVFIYEWVDARQDEWNSQTVCNKQVTSLERSDQSY